MNVVHLHVRLPKCPSDMFSSNPSEEVNVAVLPGGRVEVGNDNSCDDLYNHDTVFLAAIIDSLREEVERLEEEVTQLRSEQKHFQK